MPVALFTCARIIGQGGTLEFLRDEPRREARYPSATNESKADLRGNVSRKFRLMKTVVAVWGNCCGPVKWFQMGLQRGVLFPKVAERIVLKEHYFVAEGCKNGFFGHSPRFLTTCNDVGMNWSAVICMFVDDDRCRLLAQTEQPLFPQNASNSNRALIFFFFSPSKVCVLASRQGGNARPLTRT